MFRKFYIAVIILLSSAALLTSSCSPESLLPTGDPVKENDSPAQENKECSADNYFEADQPVIPELPRIAIYAGKGSWDVNVQALQNFLDHYDCEWTLFDEQDDLNLEYLENIDLIWFPGGFAAEYKYYITSQENIRSFIENGGSFVGSCAGAYYAADTLRWLGTDYDYPLNLFNGKAVGPLAGLIAWGEIAAFTLENNHPANTGFDRSLDMYYFDGPYFGPYDDQSIEVLLRYSINNEPAVIAGRFGEGKYLLLGPHPELGGYSKESPEFNLDGGQGAQWPWLYSVLLWFSDW